MVFGNGSYFLGFLVYAFIKWVFDYQTCSWMTKSKGYRNIACWTLCHTYLYLFLSQLTIQLSLHSSWSSFEDMILWCLPFKFVCCFKPMPQAGIWIQEDWTIVLLKGKMFCSSFYQHEDGFNLKFYSKETPLNYFYLKFGYIAKKNLLNSSYKAIHILKFSLWIVKEN